MAIFGGIRGLAQSFMRSAVASGWGANRTLETLREMGYGYRRTEFLADYRMYTGAHERRELFKFIRKGYYPSLDLYTETTGIQRTAFRYQVDVDVLKPQTGDRFTLSTNIASDRQMSMAEIEREALKGVGPSMDRSEFSITGYKTVGAYHKAGEMWD